MKGLELSEKYYNEYGKQMLDEQFSHLSQYLAIGLCGSGSECSGFDDILSQDHDFEPGFCIFLPDENTVTAKDEFLLERAYSKLPNEFMGFKRNTTIPVGGSRHGVIRISNFFEDKTGSKNGELSIIDWFSISEQFLIEATNGKIFSDPYGLITQIRQKLSYLPEDVRLKKIAGNLLIMAQSGQYNYQRCINRREFAAAQLSMYEFVKSTLNTIFLLNKKYIPYYKWIFKALKELNTLSSLDDILEYILSSSNTENEFNTKYKMIENISSSIIKELVNQKLTNGSSINLESHAYSVNNMIRDPQIRNLHVMHAV